MRITICILSLLCVALFSFAQNATDSKGKKQGVWTKSFPSGKPRYTGSFVDDKPSGEFVYYYESGNLKAKNFFYRDGSRSRVELYNPKGIKEAQGCYAGPLKDSLWVYYNPQGNIILKESYANGKKNGVFETLSPDGLHTEEITGWKDDIKNGPWIQFYKTGTKRVEAYYNKGELDSVFKVYYPEGKVKIEGRYKTAGKQGEWLEYNSDGSLRLQEIYKKGVLIKSTPLNGVFKTTFPNGLPESEYTYRSGKKNGPFVEYYNSGRLVKQSRQNEEGVMETYEVPEGIIIKRKGVYKDNEIVGTPEYFNEKGKPIKAPVVDNNNKKGKEE